MSTKAKIFLNISDIASFIGKNPYDCIAPFERLWKKCDSTRYNYTLNNINESLINNQINEQKLSDKIQDLTKEFVDKKITKHQYTSKLKEIEKKQDINKKVVKELTEKVDSIKLTKIQQVEKALGTDIINKINDSKVNTETKRTITNKLIEDRDDLSEESKKKLKTKTENVINTTHGTLKEDSAISLFEKKFNVKLDTSQNYFKKQLKLKENSKYDWYIGGKLDGLYIDNIDPKNSYVVEVKNRTKGFFNQLRDYEKVQIQLYIWMVNTQQAKLVEQHNGKIRITAVYRDESFLEDIFESLEIFTKNIETKFLDCKNENKIKKEYLNKNNSEKNIFISQLYLSEISIYLNNKFENKIIENESEQLNDDLD